MQYRDRITIKPGKRGGRPCVRGPKIAVSDVMDWLALGLTEADILDDYTELEPDDIRARLAFAAAREHRTHVQSA